MYSTYVDYYECRLREREKLFVNRAINLKRRIVLSKLFLSLKYIRNYKEFNIVFLYKDALLSPN